MVPSRLSTEDVHRLGPTIRSHGAVGGGEPVWTPQAISLINHRPGSQQTRNSINL